MSEFDNEDNPPVGNGVRNKFKMNLKLIGLLIISIFVVIGLTSLYFFRFKKTQWIMSEKTKIGTEETEAKPQGIMILIEYKDTIGLVNFVNEMHKRHIPGLLHVSPEFVEANCSTIKELLKYDMEIMASLGNKPFWDMSYADQKAVITGMKDTIEVCTGVPVKIISSPYMASDMTTIQVAEELGIPYVTARGTTDTKATIYQIEGFNTKILSVSNIPKVQFKYGSLCDYSYYERSGTPDDMMAELMRAVEPLSVKEQVRFGSHHKITPVSHTNIGGYLKPWTDMWLNFWDTNQDKIEWVKLDEFMAEVDWTLPDWQLPINKNAPYTPEKIRPITPYEDVEKVQNPCRIEDIDDIGSTTNEQITNQMQEQINVGDKIVMFHNGNGPMCLEALDFIKTVDYPVEQYLDFEEGFEDALSKLKEEFKQSEGVSQSFGYYPIIFIKDKSFSGFNAEIKSEILQTIAE